MTSLVRGQVVRANVGQSEPKLFVVVSNNARNRNFEQVLAARLTTTQKSPRPSIVEVEAGEAFVGRVVCDDIETIWADEVVGIVGGLSPRAMSSIDRGLLAALGIAIR